MTDEQNISGGEPTEQAVPVKKEKNVVDYASYQKAVSEAKAAKERAKMAETSLEEMLKSQSQAEEAKLNEQGEFQKIAELKEEELRKIKAELDAEAKRSAELSQTLIDSHKLDALRSKLPGKFKRPEYQNFVDLDSIVIDPESGRAEESSVNNVASSFMENHSSLLDLSNFKGLPSDAPKGSAAKFSQNDWKNLSLADKKSNWDRRPSI